MGGGQRTRGSKRRVPPPPTPTVEGVQHVVVVITLSHRLKVYSTATGQAPNKLGEWKSHSIKEKRTATMYRIEHTAAV